MADIHIPLPTSGTSNIPVYQDPHLIATYSHLPDRSISNNDTSMSYYTGATAGDDLKAGYGNFIERDPMLEEHLDGLCQALLKFRKEGGKLKEGALITWRGMLTRLLVAAFSDKERWEMNVLAFDGNVYLEDHLTKEARLKRQEDENSYKQQSYFGYSFEAFSTTDGKAKAGKNIPDKAKKRKRSADIAVNTNVQWCCVVKGKIGKVRLYMGGEVDCIEGDWQKDMKQCIELKTNMVISNGRQRNNFERKLMKHWAQSYLLGVPRIEVGFRDVQGIVTSTETFYTSQIPRMIRETPRPPWDAMTCLQVFEVLATRILEEVIPTDPIPDWRRDGADTSSLPDPLVWRIAFEPSRGLTLKRLGSRVPEAQQDESPDRWGFLPKAFVQEMLEAIG